MSIADQKKKFYRRVQKAKRAIERSGSIPPHLKSFLLTFTGFASSVCDYEVIWTSQTHLAKTCGYRIGKDSSCRTIKRHISLLRRIGAIKVRRMGANEAKTWFFTQYEYHLKTCSEKHLQNFYIINWGHPLWRQGDLDAEMLNDHRKANRGEIKNGTNESNRDSGGRFKSIKKSGNTSDSSCQDTCSFQYTERQGVTRFEVDEPGHTCPDRTGSRVTRKKKTRKRTAENAPSSCLETPGPPSALSGTDSVTKPSPILDSKTSPGRNLARPHPESCFAEHLPPVTTLPELETLSRDSQEIINDELPGDVLSQEEIEFLESLDMTALAGGECKAAATAASLCRNKIPVGQRGSMADLFEQPFKKNGVPKIDSDVAPWFQYQRPELRHLELVGRNHG
jgi:hypothetical protein